jgi:hypothetical protein
MAIERADAGSAPPAQACKARQRRQPRRAGRGGFRGWAGRPMWVSASRTLFAITLGGHGASGGLVGHAASAASSSATNGGTSIDSASHTRAGSIVS